MKNGFTLAEVLITLGIIGVVAALTIPTLISNYKKHVYYTQFKKGVSQLEQAFKMYEVDKGCEGNIRACIPSEFGYFTTEDIMPYFNVSIKINNDNFEKICKEAIENAEKKDEIYEGCVNGLGFSGTFAFITVDGILYNFNADSWDGGGCVLDINGLKGPNEYGIDKFDFYLPFSTQNTSEKIIWDDDALTLLSGEHSK